MNFSMVRDSLINFATSLGVVGRDPTVSAQFLFTQLNRNQLEAMFRGDWISRKIVEAPAEDATREWRQWQANDAQIEALELIEKKHDLRRKVRQAIIKARLYGGGALILGVDQGEVYEPLKIDQVGKDDLKFVVVLHCHELSAGPRIFDVNSEWYTRPEYYTISTPMYGFSLESSGKPSNVVPFGVGTNRTPSSIVQIHPSRVIEFIGNELPDWRQNPLGGGWGDSVLQTAEDVIRDIGLITGGMANMVNDAKMDVIKLPNFSKGISTDEYANRLLKRFMVANTTKSTINSIILDKEEEWERIQTNFGGLPGLLQEFLVVVSGAAEIPISRLMGNAPSRGLGKEGSGGGEQDLRNYYDKITSQQNTIYRPALDPLDEIIIRSSFGTRDPNIHYEWRPLWKMDEKDKAAISAQKASTTQIYVNLGLLNESALREGVVNQLVEDSVYPGLEDAIEEFGSEPDQPDAPFGYDPATGEPATKLPILQQHAKELAQDPKTKVKAKDYDPNEPRNEKGEWTAGGGGSKSNGWEIAGKVAKGVLEAVMVGLTVWFVYKLATSSVGETWAIPQTDLDKIDESTKKLLEAIEKFKNQDQSPPYLQTEEYKKFREEFLRNNPHPLEKFLNPTEEFLRNNPGGTIEEFRRNFPGVKPEDLPRNFPKEFLPEGLKPPNVTPGPGPAPSDPIPGYRPEKRLNEGLDIPLTPIPKKEFKPYVPGMPHLKDPPGMGSGDDEFFQQFPRKPKLKDAEAEGQFKLPKKDVDLIAKNLNLSSELKKELASLMFNMNGKIINLVTDASPRTLYVRRNVLNGKAIVAWAKAQGFPTTLPADEMHVTIAFSRQPVDWMKVETWQTNDKDDGTLTIPAGGPRMMEKLGSAIVLLFASSPLSWRHEQIKRDTGASWDHPEYQPHISIMWSPEGFDWQSVEPYRGPIELGHEIFSEIDDE